MGRETWLDVIGPRFDEVPQDGVVQWSEATPRNPLLNTESGSDPQDSCAAGLGRLRAGRSVR